MGMNMLDDQLVRLDELDTKCDNVSRNLQIQLVQTIYDTGFHGQQKLLYRLINHYSCKTSVINYIDGFIFHLLLASDNQAILKSLNDYFPLGIMPLESALEIDYVNLQKLLVAQQFKKANQLTHIKFCELAQALGNHSREWLYFTDILAFPSIDLYTIDKLWNIHSQGLFGISTQRQIWLSDGLDWNQLWNTIGWKQGGTPCRYPEEFVWDLTAPAGHLPLFNQLRGPQVMHALFTHKLWMNTQELCLSNNL